MFRAKIYPKKEIFYTDNIRASVTNCMSAIDIKNLFQASFLKRAVKSVSVATHLFRGIIVKIRKSLRCGTALPGPVRNK